MKEYEPPHYVYRMHHDTGYAPNVKNSVCTLYDCKYSKNGRRKNIEEAAEIGSWIIGIGGNKTGLPNKLIYAMEVTEKTKVKDGIDGRLPRYELRSRKFFYFGNNAIGLEGKLKELIVTTQGYKCVSKEIIEELKHYINQSGFTNSGEYGSPNNTCTDMQPQPAHCQSSANKRNG